MTDNLTEAEMIEKMAGSISEAGGAANWEHAVSIAAAVLNTLRETLVPVAWAAFSGDQMTSLSPFRHSATPISLYALPQEEKP